MTLRWQWTRRRVLIGVGLALVAGSTLFCSPGYVLRAGMEEAKILGRRQPLDEVIDAPGTAEDERRKLELVRDARMFAERELGLDAGDSYTTYSRVDSDTLLMVVTASRKDAFEPVTWWFPIVGSVTYKGFFDADDAHAEARRLADAGYDTHVRPSGAFSTLGWFNDPVLSTILRYDDVALASTVIHEITHNTIYIPGQGRFNESLANFVGDVGAMELFCRVDGEAAPRCLRARDAWADNILFGDAVHDLIGRLERLYAREDLDSEQKVERRDAVIETWRADYERDVVPRLRTGFRTFHRAPINNATLIGLRMYYDRLALFDDAYRALGSDLRNAFEAIVDAAEAHPEDPYEGLADLADS